MVVQAILSWLFETASSTSAETTEYLKLDIMTLSAVFVGNKSKYSDQNMIFS